MNAGDADLTPEELLPPTALEQDEARRAVQELRRRFDDATILARFTLPVPHLDRAFERTALEMEGVVLNADRVKLEMRRLVLQ
jgi:hypothetical protein